MADQDPTDDDPARAFDALRETVEAMARDLGSEMVVIRKGVESAFEQLDRLQPPPDYGPDLGRVVQQLGLFAKQLEAVAQSPLLRQGAEHQAAVMERAARGVVQPAVDQLERQAGDLERIAGNLGRQLGQGRERKEQNKWLWSVGATAVVVGVLLTLFLPRLLWSSVGANAAGLILADQPWQAGAKLMQYGSPEGWSQMVSADRLSRDNADAIGQCRKTAAETKREQRCTVTVKPAGPSQ